MANRPVPALQITPEQRTALEDWSRSRALPRRMVMRARIVLAAAEGLPTRRVAADLGCTEPTVRRWRARFGEAGLEGLEEAEGRGRPPRHGRDLIERVLSTTMSPPPSGMMHWSTRTLAEHLGIGHSTVQRIWKEHRLQPHRSRSFKFSQHPELARRATEVVALYLGPPEKAIVLGVEGTSAVQVPDRTRPPLRAAQPATDGCRRNRTTTLFAALDVAAGQVGGHCSPRYGCKDFLDFLRLLSRTHPDRELHLIVDDQHPHRNAEVLRWLERHRRFHLHFTPTSAGWMDQVGGWFSLIGRRAIRRGAFQSVGQLIEVIQRFIDAWDEGSDPFVWVSAETQLPAAGDAEG